jgi:hypothetical protein
MVLVTSTDPLKRILSKRFNVILRYSEKRKLISYSLNNEKVQI